MTLLVTISRQRRQNNRALRWDLLNFLQPFPRISTIFCITGATINKYSVWMITFLRIVTCPIGAEIAPWICISTTGRIAVCLIYPVHSITRSRTWDVSPCSKLRRARTMGGYIAKPLLSRPLYGFVISWMTMFMKCTCLT